MISLVRSSCLKAVYTLLNYSSGFKREIMETEPGTVSGETVAREGWLREIFQTMLCHVFQRFALEGDESNRELIHKVLTDPSH